MALDFVLADDCCPTGGGADERRNGRGLVPAAVLARADCELAVFACRRRDPSENFRGGIKLPHSRYLPDCGRSCQFCGAAFYRRGHGKRLAAAGPVASDSGVPGGAVPLLHGARGGFVQGRRHACGQMGCFVEMEHRHVCTVLCQHPADICPDIYRGADAAGRHHWNGGCYGCGTGVPVSDGPAVSPHCGKCKGGMRSR